ncbi:MAG: hypothetical protein Q8Q54_03830 [Methylococcales bacterium]|nr:hypothetical protein [Methylococcales bacterium]MDP3838033.1 hypothetical protein [Methylococcales bacterium]
MKPEKFSDWLKQSLLFISRDPIVWVSYTLLMGVLLMLGRVSPALGIFLAVVCLFVGVGIAKYIDMKSSEQPVSLGYAINKSLPLAILAATIIVLCWFVFMVMANIFSGEPEKIGQFFFYWQLTPENLNRQTSREIASWIYGYANITLIFTLLMMTTFASWFTHSLMLFKDYSWSAAKETGNALMSKHQNALYKLLGFVFLEAVLCASVTPLLTPVLYMLTSTLMYISYKNVH